MREKLIFLVSVIIFSACMKNEKVETSISINSTIENIEELKKRVITEGDVEAYQDLRTAYLDFTPESFLYYAMLMANKYDFVDAYLDVFYSVVDASIGGDYSRIDELDSKTRGFAINYLQLAASKGNEVAKELLNEINEVK